VKTKPGRHRTLAHLDARCWRHLLGLWGLPTPSSKPSAYTRRPHLLTHATAELVDVATSRQFATVMGTGGTPSKNWISLLSGIGIDEAGFQKCARWRMKVARARRSGRFQRGTKCLSNYMSCVSTMSPGCWKG